MTYYSPIETNVLCIIMLALILINGPKHSNGLLLSHRIYKTLILFTMLLCLVDMVLYHVNGVAFVGSRHLNELLNILYIEIPTVLSFTWSLYVMNDLNSPLLKNRRKMILWSLPISLTLVLSLTEPLTSFMFSLDENILYHRGDGLLINWIISWFYLIVSAILVWIAIGKEKNKLRRKELYPMLLFIVPPAIACAVQMIFYGLSLIQVGMMVALEMNFLDTQAHRILTDELTGLNNRRGMQAYIDERLRNNEEDSRIFVMMMDIDRFKAINDQYGHSEGDRALIMAAEALKSACGVINGRLYLSRYGGDEFVIVGYNHSDETMEMLKKNIENELEVRSVMVGVPYTVRMSIGGVSGLCSDFKDVDTLFRTADRRMYDMKMERRARGYNNYE